MAGEVFDEDYYEHGVEKHISGYTDYHWMPEYSLPFANVVVNKYGHEKTYLDVGCAKGFLVKALMQFGAEAFGYDVSSYAVSHADDEVKGRLSTTFPFFKSSVTIAKDTLEHVPKEEMQGLLKKIHGSTNHLMVVVPLGDQGKFRIREYEMDITHVVKENEDWWIQQFRQAGFRMSEFYYALPGVKDNWTQKYPFGNGIFFLEAKK